MKVLKLCDDRELPIRVEAATALRTFLDIKQEEIISGILPQIPLVMENLFNIFTQVRWLVVSPWGTRGATVMVHVNGYCGVSMGVHGFESSLVSPEQVQENEMVVYTLETLILNFASEIPPYAVQLVTCLSSTLLKMIDMTAGDKSEGESPTSAMSSNYDEEDYAISAISVASTISRYDSVSGYEAIQ